ncbi:hypothetical protein CRG98_031534 [Punica granatum]|uniref:Flowering time control protein FCA n=1 Tax=Punica granatum TaxID=22663 RepID=A0A2I0IWP8_PUNGR|nr:hypothetical protein CRG98_031534 [Punica granatum]
MALSSRRLTVTIWPTLTRRPGLSSATASGHTSASHRSPPHCLTLSLSLSFSSSHTDAAANLFTFAFLPSPSGVLFRFRASLSSSKLDRHRGDRYGNNQDGHGYRHSRGSSRYSSDAPLTHHQGRRGSSPSSFRVSVNAGGPRSFDSPPRHGPRGGGGFRPIDDRDGGGDRYGPGGGEGRGYEQNYDGPTPISGQKRGFSQPGRGGPSPDHSEGAKYAKLFVGSVPSTVTEEDIRPLFEEHGNVIEVALIRDRRTGQQRGCCFIKYSTSEEADRAIRALHNQYTLPGGVGPIQVRYADGERERLGAVEYKLFVGSLNKQATEQEVEEIFAPYGRVEDVYLMRDDMRQSRGCGFVKYAHKDMAWAAINALNGIYTMRGCDQPLTVRFADPKRPRLGDSRGGATLGGPGAGPRFQLPGTRPPTNFNEPSKDRAPPSAWNPMGMQDQGPPSSVGNRGYMNQLPWSSDMAASLNPNAPVTAHGGPTDGLLPAPMAPPSSLPQQSFNPSFQQFPAISQQISPSQKPLQSPSQSLPPTLQRQPQLTASYSQAQTSYAQVGPSGPLQNPSIPTPFTQALPTQPLLGPGVQSAASSATALQAPPSINLHVQPRPSPPNQPHQFFPPGQPQQFPQPPLQSPSPLAQMLTQQTQALRASFQSSQQAFSQLQQQLQMMQPSNQNVAPQQQSSQPVNQQSQWPKNIPQTAPSNSIAVPAGEVPSSSPAAAAAAAPPVVPGTTVTVGPVKCTWTEHTSPDGFKYYYNSVTGESRWIEPEELKIYKQQQQLQQQKPPVQQAQLLSQPYPQVLSTQNQQLQPQALSQMQFSQQPQQAQPQALFSQQPLQQHPLNSPYQASGPPPSRQNVQEPSYPQYQVGAYPNNDPTRFQQIAKSGDQLIKGRRKTANYLTLLEQSYARFVGTCSSSTVA